MSSPPQSQTQSNTCQPEDTTDHDVDDEESGPQEQPQRRQSQPSETTTTTTSRSSNVMLDQHNNHDDAETTLQTDDNDDDKRRMQRILANRNSARVSYLRRKSAVLELRSLSEELSRRNSDLMVENMELRQQLQELRRQMTLLLMATRPSTIQSPSVTSLNPSLVLAGMAGTQSQSLLPSTTIQQPHTHTSLSSSMHPALLAAGITTGTQSQNIIHNFQQHQQHLTQQHQGLDLGFSSIASAHGLSSNPTSSLYLAGVNQQDHNAPTTTGGDNSLLTVRQAQLFLARALGLPSPQPPPQPPPGI